MLGEFVTRSLRLSIVIPCLNEETNIEMVLSQVMNCFQVTAGLVEVIVVDNGSTDNTALNTKKFPVVLLEEKNRGYGSALRAGIERAKGTIIVFLDGDGTYLPTDAQRAVEALEGQGSGMIIGSRVRGFIEEGAMPWLHRTIGTPFLGGLVKILFPHRLSDLNSGLRAIYKSEYQSLTIRATGMEFAFELAIEAIRQKVLITEIPISYCKSRQKRESKLRPFRDGLRIIKLIFEKWFEMQRFHHVKSGGDQ